VLSFGARRWIGFNLCMATFLLTWNPDAWAAGEKWLEEHAGQASPSDPVPERWSTGGRRSGIAIGDRALLMRLRRDRGLVASGHFTSDIFDDLHWDGSGRTTQFAEIDFDCIVTTDERLPVEVLRAEVPEVHWDRLQRSGVGVPDPAIDRLEGLWRDLTAWDAPEVHPDDVPSGFYEGALKHVTVNRYERNRAARAACLRHHGTSCTICGFDFQSRYGPIGEGGIHVHHLVELSTVGRDYRVDPVNDLIPVCPNCHAMLHSSTPPLTPGQLKGHLRR